MKGRKAAAALTRRRHDYDTSGIQGKLGFRRPGSMSGRKGWVAPKGGRR